MKEILKIFFCLCLGFFIGRAVYNFNDNKNIKELEKFLCEEYFYNEVLKNLKKDEYIIYGFRDDIDKKFFIKRIK